MKKRILLLAIAIISLSTLAYGTLAYFTSEAAATNTITTGNIKIALHDKTIDNVDFPVGNIIDIVPGTIIDKKIYVENIKDNSLYTRIKLEKKITPAKRVKDELSVDKIELDINTTDWTYSEEDGYYYYNTSLAKGEKTKPLFSTVTFCKDIGNEYMNSELKINIYAQAVQSKNNGDTVFKAAGWPVSEVTE